MTLLLFHPQVAAIDCKDCLRRPYDLKTGKPMSYRSGPNREEAYFWGDPPPCKTGEGCPKGQPGESDLSPRNQKAWVFYLRGRAVGFRGFLMDALSLDTVAIIDAFYRAWEHTEARRGMHDALQLLAPLIGRK